MRPWVLFNPSFSAGLLFIIRRSNSSCCNPTMRIFKSGLPLQALSAVLVSGLLHLPAASANGTSWDVAGMLIYSQPDSERDVDVRLPGLQLNANLPWQPLEGFDLQVMGAWQQWQREDGTGDDSQFQLGVDALRPLLRWRDLEAFALGGVSMALEDVAGDSTWQPTLSLGAGLLWPVADTGLTLRSELRAQLQDNDYINASSSRSALLDGRLGLGLSWVFGGGSDAACLGPRCEDAATADEDADGIPDQHDLCLESLPSAVVDSTGCEPAGLRDSDGDGILDNQDSCPATPPGTEVQHDGCAAQAEVVLQGVTFEFNSDQLTAEARMNLEPVAMLLKGGLSEIRIEIAGHTDALGGEDYNQALSARRAYAVKKFLVSQGVDAARMVATGYGSSRPVADNETEAGRALNRRVVFRVMD